MKIESYIKVPNFYLDDNGEKKNFSEVKEIFKKYASYFIRYPDMFIDMITPANSKFKLFFYQRLFLRIVFRYQYVFGVLNRGASKSFLIILALILRCIMFPRIKLFVCSNGKEQSANITKEKVEEIFELFPILEREVFIKSFQKDYVKLTFQNGSKLDIVGVQQSSRGGRRNGGVVEECVLVDGDILNSVIIPMMAVNRRASNGKVDPNEIHKQQLYVSTAGDKSCFAYQKLKELIKKQVTKGTAFVFGSDFRLPVLHDLLDENFVQEMKEDGSFNPYDFAREWGSEWTGAGKDAFFDLNSWERNRVLSKAEHKHHGDRRNTKDIYVISCDVARCEGKHNADTGIVVKRLKILDNGTYTKQIVNVITIEGGHFEDQSIFLKQLVFTYEASMLVVDANGLGVGLVDYLVKENIDKNSGEVYPPFEVTNDERYDKYHTDTSLPLLFNIKTGGAAGEVSSDVHVKCLSQIASGKVKFLVDELTAKQAINKEFKGKLDVEEEVRLLLPYIRTSVMKDQMMNLRGSQEGKNVILKKVVKSTNKDLFSALEYGLFYIVTVLEEENRQNLYRNDDDIYFFHSSGF